MAVIYPMSQIVRLADLCSELANDVSGSKDKKIVTSGAGKVPLSCATKSKSKERIGRQERNDSIDRI